MAFVEPASVPLHPVKMEPVDDSGEDSEAVCRGNENEDNEDVAVPDPTSMLSVQLEEEEEEPSNLKISIEPAPPPAEVTSEQHGSSVCETIAIKQEPNEIADLPLVGTQQIEEDVAVDVPVDIQSEELDISHSQSTSRGEPPEVIIVKHPPAKRGGPQIDSLLGVISENFQKQKKKDEDRHDVFGKYVAAKMRDISDPTQRLVAEKIINDALFMAEMSQN